MVTRSRILEIRKIAQEEWKRKMSSDDQPQLPFPEQPIDEDTINTRS